jgi:uncharacterized protein
VVSVESVQLALMTACSKLFVVVLVVLAAACSQPPREVKQPPSEPAVAIPQALPDSASPQLRQLLASATEQTTITTGYDPAYVSLKYPGGDVPIETGVCSDVLVRAFRKAGVDLQKEVHEDMTLAWSAYPRAWGAALPDTNIDHRRVLNLMTFFERKGKKLAVTKDREDYLPGDIVAWDLGGGIEHIGIVSNLSTAGEGHQLIIHNIGAGTKAEDVLFNWKIIGHYRFF